MKSNLVWFTLLKQTAMSNKCQKQDCDNTAAKGKEVCISHTVDFKAYCKKHNYCVRCTYEHPKEPTRLSDDGLLCPICDYDEYEAHIKK